MPIQKRFNGPLSKIVLGEFDNVHYFPSYEMVTLSSPAEAWTEDDFRHVNPDLVYRIMRKVISTYIDPDLLPPLKTDLTKLYKNKELLNIIAQTETYLSRSGNTAQESDAFIKYYLGASYLQTGQNMDLGLELMELVLQDAPGHANARRLLEKYS